jgi:hypothetical protein
MVFPYIYQADYETGDFSQWTTVTNPGTPAQMAVRHYAELVQMGAGEVPYRGAYAHCCDLSLGAASAFVATGALTPLATGAARVLFYVSPNVQMTVASSVTLARIDSGADQTSLLLDNPTGTPRLTVQGTYGGGQARSTGLALGQWHCFEAVTTGTTLQPYFNGSGLGAPMTGLAATGLTGMRVGMIAPTAGLTQGFVLFDQLAVDEARVYGLPERYPQIITVLNSGVVIPGSGRYARINLIAGHDTDNTLDLYDSDVALHPNEERLAPTLTSDLADRSYHPGKEAGYFQHGLKVVMTGTAPQAVIVLAHAMCASGAIAEWARRRPPMRVA